MDPRTVVLSPSGNRTAAPRALCAGLIASDFLTPAPFPVPRDTKVRVPGFTRQGGGPAANAAVALSRLGVSTAFLGAVGEDALGEAQLRDLATEGVDGSAAVRVAGAPSFVAFILIDPEDGTRTIFSSPDERPALPADVALPVPAPDLLLLDGWVGPAAARLVDEVRGAGAVTVLDAGTAGPETVDLVGRVDVAIVSEPFAEAVAGGTAAGLAWLRDQGPRLFAVTEGERGVRAGAQGTEATFHVPAFPVAVEDTTGAGDAFHAGAAWGLLEGASWEECLIRGAAVAACKCRERGARAGLPDAEAVAALRSG